MEWPVIESDLIAGIEREVTEGPAQIGTKGHWCITHSFPTHIASVLSPESERSACEGKQGSIHYSIILTAIIGLPAQKSTAQARHNGKVERSHRNDNERFYNNLKFDSLEDLRIKGKKYLERSNKIPMAVLGYKTPLEKRQELIISLPNNYNTFISLVNAG